MAAAKRVDLVKSRGAWQAKSRSRLVAPFPPFLGDATKRKAVRLLAAWARAHPQAISVRIHRTDGTIQEERTYPRAADPRRRRG